MKQKMRVQNRNGSVVLVIPKKTARDEGINVGDIVMVEIEKV